jgi:hypothetical protein
MSVPPAMEYDTDMALPGVPCRHTMVLMSINIVHVLSYNVVFIIVSHQIAGMSLDTDSIL